MDDTLYDLVIGNIDGSKLPDMSQFSVVEILNRMNYRIGVIRVIGTYHANILKQYVEHQSVTSHYLFSIETVAEVDKVDETDEYLLDGCTFPSTQRAE